MSPYLVATAKDLGELIRGFRKQRDWTQARLADQAGLLPKTVSAIEAGGGQVLLANVMRCLSALEVDVFLDSRSGTGTMPDPIPTTVRPPEATPVRVRPTAVKRRRPAGAETQASIVSAQVTTKRPRSNAESRMKSAAKALKEKW